MNDENKTAMKSYQISYLKPMDWPRLEALEARGFRDQGGILAERVFVFFSPGGAKSLIAN